MGGIRRNWNGRVIGCVVVLLASARFSAPTFAAAPQRMNVLFLMADDLNNSLGCYGDPRVKTPNLDRLAARGVRFDRAYCQYPLCGPSRNVLLTGLYSNSNGILVNGQIFRETIPDHHSLPQAFRLAGYFAGRVGKLYHFGVPGSIGTDGHDDPASWELQLNPAGCDRLEEQPRIFSLIPGQFGATLSWYASPKRDAEHTDGMNAADAEWVLERCARRNDRPFFLGVGFFRPHTPYVSPRAYFDRYSARDMPIVRGIKEDQMDLPPAALAGAKKEQEKLTDELRQETVQAYYASISFMDAQVGRVLDALDRLGLADKTIVVFASDHGYHLGEHGLWQKMSLFEEVARVPLIVAAPGAAKGAVVKSPVGLIDLYPTLLELCGIEGPGHLQGQSLVPMLRDASSIGRGWALTQIMRMVNREKKERYFGYSLRTARWRYTEWAEGEKGRELYDHDADPRELTNLAADPALAATVEQLSTQLRAAVKSTFPESGKTPELRPGVWTPKLAVP
jgi:iduronate 2-sulfatase